MAIIGSLAVNIVAKTSKFTKGIGKSLSATKRFTAGIGRMSGGIATMAAGLASVVSIGALKSIANDLDLVAKTATKLGIASEKLIGLQHAASQTGVSAGVLDKALQKMAVNVADAGNGTGEARDAIRALGISAKQLASQSIEQQFSTIATAVQGMTDKTKKLTAVYDIFGGRGTALINTLDLGADGLKKMQRQAEGLGIAFSGAELKKVEEMNDALDRLGRSAGAVGQGIVISLAPGLARTFDDLAEAMRGIPGFNGSKGGASNIDGRGRTERIGKRSSRAAAFIATAGGSEVARALGLSTPEDAVEGAASAAIGFLERATGSFGGQLSAEQQAASKARFDASVARGDAGDAKLIRTNAAQETQSKLVTDFSARFGKMIGGVLNQGPKLADTVTDGMGKAFKGVSGEIVRKGKISKQAEDMIASLMTPAEKVAVRMAEVDALVSSGDLTGAQASSLKDRLKDSLGPGETIATQKRSQLTARTRGSVETFAAARRNLGGNDPMKAIADTGKEQLAESKKQTGHLEKVADAQTPEVVSIDGAT